MGGRYAGRQRGSAAAGPAVPRPTSIGAKACAVARGLAMRGRRLPARGRCVRVPWRQRLQLEAVCHGNRYDVLDGCGDLRCIRCAHRGRHAKCGHSLRSQRLCLLRAELVHRIVLSLPIGGDTYLSQTKAREPLMCGGGVELAVCGPCAIVVAGEAVRSGVPFEPSRKRLMRRIETDT